MRDQDQKVVQDGRKNSFKDSDELQVVVPLREQIQEKLLRKLNDLNEGQKTVEVWHMGNARRADWLDRQNKLLSEYDEFLEPIYSATQAWSSTLHLPIALTVAKTFHARFLSALLSVDPPFTVKARQAANEERAMLIQDLMRYTLQSWVNEYQGIDEVADGWIWNWVTRGCGILKARWDRKFTRFMDVVEEEEVLSTLQMIDPETGSIQEIPQVRLVEREEVVEKEVFAGPMLENVPPEDILIVGGDGDPQKADEVLQAVYMTASELWTLVDQKVFNKEAVEATIAAGEQYKSTDPVNAIKETQSYKAGTSGVDKEHDLKRYQVIERHARIDVDGSGINSDVILWVAVETRKILRATYLYRVMPTGLRPFFKIDFHKRHGQDYGVGIIELLYTLTKEIDAIHNMKIDFGLISTMPFGFYRATSSMSEERIPFEPGMMVPLDNPQTDVFFPNLGNRTSFGVQEESMLMQSIERFTSISDISLGIVGGQGATRTATGTRALLGEANANLDVFLRRMNRGWKRVLIYLFHMLQQRLPPGFDFRITGDDGHGYWKQVKSKEELCGMYDFELEANSANSNKMVQIEQANQIYATLNNPLLIQLGIVSPLNIYNALKFKLQVEGTRDFGRFISKPQGQMRIYTPIELLDATLAGVDLPLGPEQDLQGFIALCEEFLNDDHLLGQFGQQHLAAMVKKMREAQAMLQAVEAQAAQQANQQQVAMNAAMTSPSPAAAGQAQVAAPAPPIAQEG